jgi:hypothetical protein
LFNGKGGVMAKEKCINCSAKPGKRKCMVRGGELICPVCCATVRDENCEGCQYYEISANFQAKKIEKETASAGSYFGSPVMQKSIMEASMDMMNTHAAIGAVYDKEPEKFVSDSFEFFNSDEFSDFTFSDDEIKEIIKAQGEPGNEPDWFHTEEGTDYYTKAVSLVMNDRRFREFSKTIMAVFLKYYRKNDFEKAWLILSTSNRLMEGDFAVPFTILMFFRGISRWKLGKNLS